MRNYFFAALLAALASASLSAEPIKDDGTWRPIFFEEIDRVAAAANLQMLRTTPLKANETEIRVWEGFGLSPLRGYVFTRGTKPKAWFVRDGATSKAIVPKGGWGKLWKELDRLKIEALPDSTTLSGEVVGMDGTSYVVEVRKGSEYRSYYYGNPDDQPWPEAKIMLSIAALLRREFQQ